MAARLCCQLDPARDVLCLRPVGAESRGRPISGPFGTLPSPSASAVPTDHGAHLFFTRSPRLCLLICRTVCTSLHLCTSHGDHRERPPGLAQGLT
nr:X protein [HBV genotype C1]BDX28522.1 X protein [HBV genotype C1]